MLLEKIRVIGDPASRSRWAAYFRNARGEGAAWQMTSTVSRLAWGLPKNRFSAAIWHGVPEYRTGVPFWSAARASS